MFHKFDKIGQRSLPIIGECHLFVVRLVLSNGEPKINALAEMNKKSCPGSHRKVKLSPKQEPNTYITTRYKKKDTTDLYFG